MPVTKLSKAYWKEEMKRRSARIQGVAESSKSNEMLEDTGDGNSKEVVKATVPGDDGINHPEIKLATKKQIEDLAVNDLAVSVDKENVSLGEIICPFCEEIMDSPLALDHHSLSVHGDLVDGDLVDGNLVDETKKKDEIKVTSPGAPGDAINPEIKLATKKQIEELAVSVKKENKSKALGEIICPFCEEIMDSPLALENHSLSVHGDLVDEFQDNTTPAVVGTGSKNDKNVEVNEKKWAHLSENGVKQEDEEQGFVCKGRDPFKLENRSIYQTMVKATRGKYIKTWNELCNESAVAIGKPPSIEAVFQFFKKRVERDFAHSTLKTMYSHINSAVDELYGVKLDKFRRIYRFIQITAPQSKQVTKARAFEPEELGMAFKKIDFDNRYELVRAAVASVAYFGANRMAEIKDLKVSDVKPCPEGYRITFAPKKQRGPPKTETFLVPKESAIADFYYPLHKYVETLNKEIGPSQNEPFWYCGRVLKNGQTKFVKQCLGIGEIRAVPRFLAEKLGYDANTTLEFKGHSLRRTAATILADQGASGQTLRNKLNHSSEKTVSEYISSSKKVQATNASLLGNVTIENQEPKPEAKKQKMEETQSCESKVEKKNEDEGLQIFKDSGFTFQSCTVNIVNTVNK